MGSKSIMLSFDRVTHPTQIGFNHVRFSHSDSPNSTVAADSRKLTSHKSRYHEIDEAAIVAADSRKLTSHKSRYHEIVRAHKKFEQELHDPHRSWPTHSLLPAQ